MPRYKSVNGKWVPTREYHVDGKAEPGTNPVYEGPDRAATEVLQKEGVEFLGEDCRESEETMIKARKVGCNTVDEYLKKYKGIDLDKEKEKAEKFVKDNLFRHDAPVVRKPAARRASGGDNVANPKDSLKGGFGDPSDIKIGDLSKRA